MTVIIAALTGFVAGRMLWLAMRKSWNRQALMRTNFQGVSLPTAAGIVLPLTLLLVEAARAVIASIGIGNPPGLTDLRAAGLVAVFSFALLGLLDDLVGSTGARGFNGHFQALVRGELTSGMIKLVGGTAAALVAASLIDSPGFGALITSALIIALSANLFNLLDLRPGRTSKVGLFVFALAVIGSGFATTMVPTAIVVGAVAALLLDDLHERLMLGDTGANALGAAIGLGLAAELEGTARLVVVLVLLGLNVLSEFVSFSKIIDTVAPLRMLDQMGRRRPQVIDIRDDVLDAEPLAPFGEAGSSSAPPFTSRPPERDNVGGARDGDLNDIDQDLVDGPSDLFGISEDDYDPVHPNPHRHN